MNYSALTLTSLKTELKALIASSIELKYEAYLLGRTYDASKIESQIFAIKDELASREAAKKAKESAKAEKLAKAEALAAKTVVWNYTVIVGYETVHHTPDKEIAEGMVADYIKMGYEAWFKADFSIL
jgi:hypothetical protein